MTKVDSEVPAPKGSDVTGLATPAPGMRLIGVNAKVCNEPDQAIGAFNFGLKLDGAKATPRYAQQSYPDTFESFREGCEEGWIVFEGPIGHGPKAVTFKYDDTGSARRSDNSQKHLRFRWTVD